MFLYCDLAYMHAAGGEDTSTLQEANGDVPLGSLGSLGSHFREWIDYNGVAHFRILGVRQFFIFMVSKCTRMFVLQMKSKVFFIHYPKNGSINKNRK